jgi:phospholipid-transporting ATPase
LALTLGAKQSGYELISRSASEITIKNHLMGRDEKYRVLAEFPFDSTRKRMSLIIETEGKYSLMCKGADSIVLPRCLFNT